LAPEGYITQMKLPFTAHVLRVVWRNLLIFFHNFVIVVVVMMFSPPPLTGRYSRCRWAY
jgi:ABC-2 type transport system permease protein